MKKEETADYADFADFKTFRRLEIWQISANGVFLISICRIHLRNLWSLLPRLAGADTAIREGQLTDENNATLARRHLPD
ncbi:MAG: hypothetical protein IPH95_17075 [Candidatus Promineofilum sp.]|nr:hypothetical protein [Promineifilum sp.]